MSFSVLDHRQSATVQIVRSIKEARSRFERQKTLQLQGNQALKLGVLDGYINVEIPTTAEPNAESIEIVAPGAETIVIGNLMWSVFYVVEDPLTPTEVRYEEYDSKDLFYDQLDFSAFLSYDRRPKGSGSLPDEQTVFDTVVEDNMARLTARINRSQVLPYDIPTPYVTFFWSLRATMM